MINIIPSDQRYHADHGWLDTAGTFRFPITTIRPT